MKLLANSFLRAAMPLLLICVGGCSDQKTANEGNFATAVTSFLATQPECMNLMKLASIPGEEVVDRYESFSTPNPKLVTVEDFLARKKTEAALANAGFIEVETAQREIAAYEGSTTTQLQSLARVTLTAKGRPWYRVVSTPGIGEHAAFCFAEKQLKTIDNFTEPSDMRGQKVSHVAYTWQLGDVAKWVDDEAFGAADGRVRMTLAKVGKPQSGHATLILTDKGWVHEKLFSDNK